MHGLGEMMERFLFLIHSYQGDLIWPDGSCIHQGVESWKDILGVFVPGGGKDKESYLFRPGTDQGCQDCIGGISAAVLMKPGKGRIFFQHVAADESF